MASQMEKDCYRDKRQNAFFFGFDYVDNQFAKHKPCSHYSLMIIEL